MQFIILLIEVAIVIQIALGLASFCIWVERKGSALIQDRVGANRAGAFTETSFTLLKPFFWISRIFGRLGVWNTLISDPVKALLKEDFVPEGVSNFVHSLAPFLGLVPILVAFGVVPLAPEFTLGGYQIRLQVAGGLNSGALLFLAMGSLAVYGVMIAGMTSNNKYAVLGSLRASAQMISYELTMGVAVATAIISYRTLDLYEMVQAQQGWWGIVRSPWMFIAGILFFVSGMAETKRAPFDLPESESELTAGYFTEYSGMKFLLFWLGEFAEISLISLVISVVFFGGWHLPFVAIPEGSIWTSLAGHLILMTKVLFFCVLQIVIRWTLPRFRYDQLMNLGWKYMLEISFINLFLAAAWKLLWKVS